MSVFYLLLHLYNLKYLFPCCLEVNFEQIDGFESKDSVAFFNIGFYFDFKLKNPDWVVYTGV